MRHEYDVFLDLDGVLADFEGKVRELLCTPTGHPIDKRKMWSAIHRHDMHTPFFYSLDKMTDADELFDFVLEYFDHDKIKILTASGHTPTDAPQQKRRWVRKHFGDYHVEVVAKSPDKAAFASPTTILIDDRAKSLDPWIEAGGIGILHTDAKSTIEELKKILSM
jgi:hypothetical protein